MDYTVVPLLVVLVAALVIWRCARRMRSTALRRRSGLARSVTVAGLSLAIAVAGSLALSSAYNAVFLQRFRTKHPPAGRMIEVEGRRMRLFCMGSGAPTVVLETGLGNDGYVWTEIQEALAKTTRVCSYDRGGFGWSEARGGMRDADHITAELHELLAQGGISGPTVLMGHSIAGLYLRDYVARFPQGIVGLVLIDPSTPLQEQNPAFRHGGGWSPPGWLQRAALDLGLARVAGMCSYQVHDPDPLKQARSQEVCLLRFGAVEAEGDRFDDSSREALRRPEFGALPVLILSHDTGHFAHEPTPQTRAHAAAWEQMQGRLRQLSTDSRRVIAKGTTHYLFLERPAVVIAEVDQFLQRVRIGAAADAGWCRTVTE